jgi:putative transposase
LQNMPWIKVWLHFVWSTKERYPYLTDEIRLRILDHIRENARAKNIHIDFINGWLDHIHCLISLGSDQTIEEIMKLVKGESSHWINKNKLTPAGFAWQNDYFVASVSESNLRKVRKYIAEQEQHHSTVSSTEEFDSFLLRAGFERHNDVSA